MSSISSRYRLAGMIGNILENYDSALFYLLAPFIAPLFFDTEKPITALILTYALLSVGVITRPLGSLFFGWMGDRFGRRYSLFFSLTGMAIATVGMGCLPTSRQAGFWAPLLLALGRMLQNFCAAGESASGAIFVLEHTEAQKRSFMSSIYDASSIIGILIASALVTLFSSTVFSTLGNEYLVEEGWRLLCWFGGITAILGLFLRLKGNEGADFINAPKIRKINLLKLLNAYRAPFIGIIFASGFCYTTYTTAFTLMNGYIPIITSLTKTEVMKINTWLLLLDMFLLPCFGYLASKLGKEKVMFSSALLLAVSAIPLFSLLGHAPLETVIAIRLIIVTLGVAFAATYHAWALELVPPQHRCTILALGCAIGSQLIGAPSAAICLWLYQQMDWVAAPALYLAATGAIASYVIYYFAKQRATYMAVAGPEGGCGGCTTAAGCATACTPAIGCAGAAAAAGGGDGA